MNPCLLTLEIRSALHAWGQGRRSGRCGNAALTVWLWKRGVEPL